VPSDQAKQPASPELIVYNKIYDAISERRLSPGSRLVGQELAKVFGISRSRVHSVLKALARDKVVTLLKNKSAYVSEPTVEEAKEVFAARRLIEKALAHEVVSSIDAKGLKRLEAHIAKEIAAENTGDRALQLRISYRFHTLLAEIAGNQVIIDYLRELMARSALITAIFERRGVNVAVFAHGPLIELIAKRDADGLADAMLGHLSEIESFFTLYEKREVSSDLKSIFSTS